jgi:hypothetical protein
MKATRHHIYLVFGGQGPYSLEANDVHAKLKIPSTEKLLDRFVSNGTSKLFSRVTTLYLNSGIR